MLNDELICLETPIQHPCSAPGARAVQMDAATGRCEEMVSVKTCVGHGCMAPAVVPRVTLSSVPSSENTIVSSSASLAHRKQGPRAGLPFRCGAVTFPQLNSGL